MGQEHIDSNLRSALFMESAHSFLDGTEHTYFVVKGVRPSAHIQDFLRVALCIRLLGN